MLYYLGLSFGIIIGALSMFIVAVIYIVVNRLHPAGKAEIAEEDTLRREEGVLREDAGVRKEAQRLFAIDTEKERLKSRAGAQR